MDKKGQSLLLWREYIRKAGFKFFCHVVTNETYKDKVLKRLAEETKWTVAFRMSEKDALVRKLPAGVGHCIVMDSEGFESFHHLCERKHTSGSDGWKTEGTMSDGSAVSGEPPFWGYLFEFKNPIYDERFDVVFNDLGILHEEFLMLSTMQQAFEVFRLEGIVRGGNILCPLYTDSTPYEWNAVRGQERRVALFIDLMGYGDAFALSGEIQRFIDRHVENGTIVHIFARKGAYRMLAWYLDRCRVYNSVLQVQGAIVLSGEYDQVYRLRAMEPTDPDSFLETSIQLMGMEPSLTPPAARSFPSTPRVQELIRRLREEHRKIIGFQWHTADSGRCWSYEEASRFAGMCKEQGIGVINLTPAPLRIEGAIDASSFPIEQLFEIIGETDLFVGIDSLCGHIAAVKGIPSISLWRLYRINGEWFNNCLHFRPFRKNFSLIAVDETIRNIKAERVLAKTVEVLDKKIALIDRRITSEDTRLGVHIEWMEDVREIQNPNC